MKKIRKMKGFTQKEVYTGVVSKSFYSDFEAGKHTVSTDKFSGLLQNLTISFAEFHYFHQQMVPDEAEQLEKNIDSCYHQGQFEELFQLYEHYHRHPKTALRFLAAKAYLLVLITNSNFYKLTREPFLEIWAALDNAKTWTINELSLAKLVLLSLPEKEAGKAQQLFQQIQQELIKYRDYPDEFYLKELTDLYFNRVQSLLILNDIPGAQKVLTTYQKAAADSQNVALQLQLRFITLLVALYHEHPTAETKIKALLLQTNQLPAAECRFYQIIFQLHHEKARNYYQRHFL